jgi:hypothetical protein
MGYVDGMGLYEAMRGNPYYYRDFLGSQGTPPPPPQNIKIPFTINGRHGQLEFKLSFQYGKDTLIIGEFNVILDPIPGQYPSPAKDEFQDIRFIQIIWDIEVKAPINLTNPQRQLYPTDKPGIDYRVLKNGVIDPPAGGFYTEHGQLIEADLEPFAGDICPTSPSYFLERTEREGKGYKHTFVDTLLFSKDRPNLRFGQL